jgi:hypothetical protein
MASVNLADYMRYVSVFNSQDWARLHLDFYTEHIAVDFPVAKFCGAEASLTWFAAAHEGVVETLVPVTVQVSHDGSEAWADLAVHFIVTGGETRNLPDPRAGTTGDHLEIPMRAYYKWADAKIEKLSVEITAPGRWSRL